MHLFASVRSEVSWGKVPVVHGAVASQSRVCLVRKVEQAEVQKIRHEAKQSNLWFMAMWKKIAILVVAWVVCVLVYVEFLKKL